MPIDPNLKYYPSLKNLITLDSLPDSFEFLKTMGDNVFMKIFYKNFQSSVSSDGSTAFYSLMIVSKEQISFDLVGLKFILNADSDINNISSFPLTLEYSWPILGYIKGFNLQEFSFSPDSFYELGLNIFNVSESQVLREALRNLVTLNDPEVNAVIKLVDDLNTQLANDLSAPISYPTTENVLDELDNDIKDKFGNLSSVAIFRTYILSSALDNTKENVELFFKAIIPYDIEDFILELIKPVARATIEFKASIQFPRNILKPVYDENGNNPYGISTGIPFEVIPPINPNDPDDPDAPKVLLTFAEALFYVDTEQGLGYNIDLVLNTNVPAQIGNTGIIIDITNLKIDLSTTTNILEADAEGRPPEFIGVYAEELAVILPKKWFKDIQQDITLQVVARRMLMGTGGISGTIALETIDTGNAPGENDILYFKIGSDDGFKVGFTAFDMTFAQNNIVQSNLKGSLTIPKFTYPPGHPDEALDVIIDVEGSIFDNGGFRLTATVQDYPIQFPGIFTYNIRTLEFGRENNDDSVTYLETTGTLQFLGFLKETLNLGPIEIEKLRIYSDGSMEFEGGSITLLDPIPLPLGPVTITVAAIHYGSFQKEVDGVMRKFSYFGFDGGLKVDPLGVEIRGDGVKYYFCTDDLPNKPNPYLHVETIYMDLTIPLKDPVAIINGELSIPEPGISQEYSGNLKLQLPRLGVTGSVDMTLMPKYPAFILDASFEFPAPIPLGAFAIYGFRGLLGYRYVAEKEAVGLISDVHRWYDYYKVPPRGIHIEKFSGPNDTSRYTDPFSLGVGASMGTSFDNGAVFNLKAMLILSIPSLFMLDGQAAILSARLGLEETKDPPFFAIAAIGDNSMEFGFGADFKMPTRDGSMLKLYAEMQAAFFFNNSSKWYVNFGTKDKPTTATILSLVELKSYLMLSASGIEAGARGELNFRRTYAGIIKVYAWAFIEVGGRVSFERPQFGAYMEAGVGAAINVKVVDLSASFQVLLSVEASEPFRIHGRVRITIDIEIAWVFTFSFDEDVDLVWEHSNYVNTVPVKPLINSDNDREEIIKTLVKGVNMLNNETFELSYLGEGNFTGFDPEILEYIIPLDTYIDIKTEKGLLPGAISDKIGGFSNPAQRYTDLIPPDAAVKGKPLRQVTHQYSIESLSIMSWNPAGGGQWVDYKPYEAMYPNDPALNEYNLKIGQFQKSGGQYNTIRLLATTPFSYTEQGEPGWFIPEQYGMTAASLFCEGEAREKVCADFLSKPLGQKYFCLDTNHMFYSNEAAFLLIDKEYFEYAQVINHPNIHGFAKSLSFDLHNKLQIILPEPSVRIWLKLTSDGQAVRIRYFSTLIVDSELQMQYRHPNPAALNQNTSYDIIVNADDLDQAVEYFQPSWRPVTKILVEPVGANQLLLSTLSSELARVRNVNTQVEAGLIEWHYQSPIPLQSRLDTLNDFSGEVKSSVYLYNVANNEYMDKADGVWSPSWNPSTDHKVESNLIGFSSKSGFLDIESEYQLVDVKILPELAEKYTVENEGFAAKILLTDLEDYLDADGNIEFVIHQYENCVKDVRLCNLHTKLRAVRSSFIDPQDLTTNELSAMQVSLLRFSDVIDDFEVRNPDYELKKASADQIKNIGTFITNPDLNNYPLAHSGSIEFMGAVSTGGSNELAGSCTCGTTNGTLESLYTDINIIYLEHFQNLDDVRDFTPLILYVNVILDLIGEYSESNPGSGIPSQIDEFVNLLELFLNNPNLQNLEGAVGTIEGILEHLDGLENHQFNVLRGKTLLHQVCWLSLESYIYNLNIPEQSAIEEDAQATVNGITQYIQPIWRPGTSYLIQFELKDLVGNGAAAGQVKYNYGFTTAGPVGYFHIDPASKYGDIILKQGTILKLKQGDLVEDFTLPELSALDDPNGVLRYMDDGAAYPSLVNDRIDAHPDRYALTSLKQYIDYERSYPNANGNLLMSKPLFYDDPQTTRIYMFFTKAYATHFFHNWEQYNGKAAIAGRLKIVIKDPSENTEIVNPPHLDYDPEDVTTIHIPQAVEQWLTDDHPLMSFAISQWSNLYNSEGHCIVTGGDPIRPASSYMVIEMKHLKPLKLYTAIVNNLFDIDSDGNFDTVSEVREVHRFVFQTSRYANFQEQIESFLLKDDANGIERKAIFNIRKDFSAEQVGTAYNTVVGVPNSADANSINYQHAYDRIFEGILGLSPLDDAISTECNIVRNSLDNNKIIAIIIRNPEPFNIPKISLTDIADTIQVLINGTVDNSYHVLYSKDYSQAIIMHSSHIISDPIVDIRFKYKLWNGNIYAEQLPNHTITVDLI